MKPHIIKFDTLKDKAKKQINSSATEWDNQFYTSVYSKITPGDALIISLDNGKSWRDNLVDMKKAACQIVDNWDVRAVGRLIALFPSIIPTRCQNKSITAFMADNENCDWMVQFV